MQSRLGHPRGSAEGSGGVAAAAQLGVGGDGKLRLMAGGLILGLTVGHGGRQRALAPVPATFQVEGEPLLGFLDWVGGLGRHAPGRYP